MTDSPSADTSPTDQLVASLDTDRTRLAALAATAVSEPDVVVATCPGWSLRDLLVHLGRVHRWAAAALATPPDGAAPRFAPRPDPSTNLGEWLDEGVGALLAAFDSTDSELPCWGFAGTADAAWWLRRQTIETAVHRWDGEAACGVVTPIGGEVAAVGVDEWCELQSGNGTSVSSLSPTSVHLHATDGDGEWLIHTDADGFTWTHGHHKGDVAVRGARSDLLLVLWNRLPLDDLEVFGNPAGLRGLLVARAI